jgi:cell division protease FtsH
VRTCWWTAASADRGIGRSQPRCYHRAGLGPSGDARAPWRLPGPQVSKGAHPLATDPGSPYRRLVRGPAIYVLVALAAIWLFLVFANRGATSDQLSFSEFQSEVAAGNVDTANFLLGDGVIEGELSDGTPYRVAYVQGTEETLTQDLQKNGVDISADPQKGSALVGFLFQLIPVILIVGAFIFIMNQSQGGGGRVMQFGKARAKLVTKDQPKTTFADVAGVDEAIEELQEVKEYLANPAKFQAMGAKIPRGVLLFGPPGSGKTLLARAVAGEAGVPFYSISGSDFVEMFVGVGAARVRDLFEQAKQSAPAIVFIDEIDAVGRHRGAGLGGGHDEREQTLNQLLVEMDGFDQRTAVILMAATNRPDILDPALLRPGRFDRQIVVDRPDLEGRKGILKVHARGKPFDETVDLSTIARRTPGFTGADLSNVINESALLAARWGKKAISMKEVEEAIDRVMAGPERKTRVMSEREKRVIAYHEGGHALVAHILPNTDPVHKISVIPRGRALGYTLTLPEEDKFLMTREELADELAMLMGGRVAEELIVGDITTGAANDIERATKVARQMVTEYGMSDTIGPQTLGQKQHEVFLGRDFQTQPDYSDQVAFEIDNEVRRMIDEAHDEALEILQSNRGKLDELATMLVERETLDRDEVETFLSDVPKRGQRDQSVRGAGLAVSRRAIRTGGQPSTPGTIPPKPIG